MHISISHWNRNLFQTQNIQSSEIAQEICRSMQTKGNQVWGFTGENLMRYTILGKYLKKQCVIIWIFSQKVNIYWLYNDYIFYKRQRKPMVQLKFSDKLFSVILTSINSSFFYFRSRPLQKMSVKKKYLWLVFHWFYLFYVFATKKSYIISYKNWKYIFNTCKISLFWFI